MDYPLISVRESLVPTAVVSVKIFESVEGEELEEAVNKWVEETQNLVVCPGPVTNKDGVSSIAITYVASGRNDDPNKRSAPKVAHPSGVPSGGSGRHTTKESDGGRLA